MSGHGQLVPLMDGIKGNPARKPREAPADAGYVSEAKPEAPAGRGISACIAAGRAKHPTGSNRKTGGPLARAMRTRLKRARRRSRYRLRKQVVEPVFG